MLLMQRKKYIWMAVVNALILYTYKNILILTQMLIDPRLLSTFYFL